MGVTITYKEDIGGWVSFKSFIPEYGMSMANNYFTFKDGEVWQHHIEGTNANDFYTPQAITNSHVDVLFNDNSDIIKRYNAINYEGTQSRILGDAKGYYDINYKQGWFVESIITDEGRDNEQHGKIPEFIEKEGKWFNYIKGERSMWNSQYDYNLDSSEFSFQGLGHVIAQPSTTAIPIVPQIFSVLDSQDDDTTPFAQSWLTLTNPLTTGQEDGFLNGLISTFGANNMPYYYGNSYTNSTTATSFEYIEDSTNTSAASGGSSFGYTTYSNVNMVTSGNTISGYQTITLVTGDAANPPVHPWGVGTHAIGAFNLRINGHTLKDVTNLHVTPGTIQSNYSDQSTSFYSAGNYDDWAAYEDAGFTTYTIQNPNYIANTSGYVKQYTLGASNTEVNVYKIEIEEDYSVFHDHIQNSLALGAAFPGYIHIKVYFEDFVMPGDNLILPIDIDHKPPAQLAGITINAEFGSIASMAMNQYYNTRSTPNFTIDGFNSSTNFSTQTLSKSAGSLVTEEITFVIRPVDTYDLSLSTASQQETNGVIDGNVWGESCDNLTNQSVWIYGRSWTSSALPNNLTPYASSSLNSSNVAAFPQMSTWLGSLDSSIDIIEQVLIDQTGANDYNVNASYVATHDNSLAKIEKIELEEWYDGYSGTPTPPPADSFPDWINVKVTLNFTMPANNVTIFIPIQHDIRRQISSLPASPWEWGCTDNLHSSNPTIFQSGNTPVNNGSCIAVPGVDYDIYIHYVYLNNAGGQFSAFGAAHSSWGGLPVVSPVAFSYNYYSSTPRLIMPAGNIGGTASDKYTATSGQPVSATFPNGWVKTLGVDMTTMLYLNYPNQNYPMGTSSDQPVAGTVAVFADVGDIDSSGEVPNWWGNTTAGYTSNTLPARAAYYGSTGIHFINYHTAPTTKRTIDPSNDPESIGGIGVDGYNASNYISQATYMSITGTSGTPIGNSTPISNPPTYQDSMDLISSIDLEEIYYNNWNPNGPLFPIEIQLTITPDFVMPPWDVHIYIPIDQDISNFHQDPNNP